MKQFSDIIATGFRLLIFSLVFSSIILQPVVESIVVSEPQAFSWLDIETENDSNEKENKELEDTKDKKVDLRFLKEETTTRVFIQKKAVFWSHYSLLDVTIDTHDPPPEVA